MSLEQLLRDQDRIATRVQLRDYGVTPDEIRAQLKAARWRLLNENVVCMHNGPLTQSQARWAVVLSVSGLVALGGFTAMERLGVKGFETTDVHVLVVRGAKVMPVDGVVMAVHESRRFSRCDVLPQLPPVTTIERTTIDAAA